MTDSNPAEEPEDVSNHINRRSVLKLVGGTTVAVGAMSGTASATQSQFYGCSQVCTDTDGNLAVVSTDSGYECRLIEYKSDRGNEPWPYDNTYCYEYDEETEEAVVGIIEESDGDCILCVNPNNCAGNYYDDPADIVADLNSSSTCGRCEGAVRESSGDECTVYGSSGDKGNGNGNDGKGNGGNNGNGKGNGKGKGR
jgi:hypothetical protein